MGVLCLAATIRQDQALKDRRESNGVLPLGNVPAAENAYYVRTRPSHF
jgi:hypothetical protein